LGILVNKETKVIVQGITGAQGSFHTRLMLDYGTKIVAGVTPGKGGTKVCDVPVYDTVSKAQSVHQADASVIFVPAQFAKDAAFEAIDAGIKLLVILTEHIPIRDSMEIMAKAKMEKTIVIGPNSTGIITPGECKLGFMPAHIFKPGIVGVISRSGTLTYEIANQLTAKNLGQSTCVGLGGDPIVGLSFVDVMKMFRDDPMTKAVVLIGEIGGDLEERAANYIIEEGFEKPTVAFIAGRTAPPEKRMGHAGAIILGKAGSAESKVEALRAAGVHVADTPAEVANYLAKLLGPKEKSIFNNL
jgi:succinyl-CoA synthetase alpha subunit